MERQSGVKVVGVVDQSREGEQDDGDVGRHEALHDQVESDGEEPGLIDGIERVHHPTGVVTPVSQTGSVPTEWPSVR